jgi:hypothetical protein
MSAQVLDITRNTSNTVSSNTVTSRSHVMDTTHTVPTQRFTTQVRVETRKLLDTRGGLAVLGLIIATCIFALVWLLSQSKYPVTFHRYSTGASNIVAFLVPVVTLMAMTAEWTQRTALTTFTMSPRRGRVLTAKFLAGLAVTTAVLVAVLLLAAGATALGGLIHGHASWELMGSDIRTYFIIMFLEVVMAAAFAAIAGQTAVALVAYFIFPTAWTAFAVNVLGRTADWFDIFAAYDRLSSPHPFGHIGQTLTAVGVWIMVPAVIGIRRSLHREIK